MADPSEMSAMVKLAAESRIAARLAVLRCKYSYIIEKSQPAMMEERPTRGAKASSVQTVGTDVDSQSAKRTRNSKPKTKSEASTKEEGDGVHVAGPKRKMLKRVNV